MNIAGFNCTMPDKTKICELIDDLSDAARMIGAVNTVVNKNLQTGWSQHRRHLTICRQSKRPDTTSSAKK